MPDLPGTFPVNPTKSVPKEAPGRNGEGPDPTHRYLKYGPLGKCRSPGVLGSVGAVSRPASQVGSHVYAQASCYVPFSEQARCDPASHPNPNSPSKSWRLRQPPLRYLMSARGHKINNVNLGDKVFGRGRDAGLALAHRTDGCTSTTRRHFICSCPRRLTSCLHNNRTARCETIKTGVAPLLAPCHGFDHPPSQYSASNAVGCNSTQLWPFGMLSPKSSLMLRLYL